MATATEAASHIYLSISRFRDLIASATITREPAGGYNLDTVRRQYCENAQKVMAGRAEEGGASLSTARARLAIAQAEKAELANAIARGEYTVTGEMVKVVEALFGTCRELILGLPGKVSDEISSYAPTADRSIIFHTLHVECRQLLTNLSTHDAMERAARAKYTAATDGGSDATTTADPDQATST